ncbi:MAG: BMP family ABC transporter substrate-binding protein [Candidatus Poribacteria bacterium]|nr:BMP family ABC transporter substrate-binding protein [Candidatus Poribacteria bacterium]
MRSYSITKYLPILALTILFIGVSGCDIIQQAILSDLPDDADAVSLRVTMIYPSDCIGDSGYCDSFHIGVRTAEAELGISLIEVAGMESDPEVAETQIRKAAQNSDLVLTVGYQMGAPLAMAAPDFPDVKFAIFDVALDVPNVASINYKANEGSFLVGAIAALKSESGKIGYIGGADVPLLQEFEAGYVAGVQAVNPDAVVIVEYISDDATGFGMPERAKEIALAQYESGADVIYTAAGGAGNGVLEAAREQQKFIIWVDSNGNYLEPGIVLTSMVKELSDSVIKVINETAEGTFIGGARYLGLGDGGVSYAVDEHNRSLLSDEVLNRVESLRAQIIAGEIVVPDQVTLPREQNQ